MCEEAVTEDQRSEGQYNFFEKWDPELFEEQQAYIEEFLQEMSEDDREEEEERIKQREAEGRPLDDEEGDSVEGIGLRLNSNEEVGRLDSDARNSLTYLNLLEKLNPVVLKEERHMTAEDRAKSDAFERAFERRKQAIKSRCNFYEVYRNKDLFERDVFNHLIQRSLAKTAESDLPTEFQPFAKYLRNYERENPGKYLIASQFGKNFAGADPSDLMSFGEYNKAFGENRGWKANELRRGQMPDELQKAMDKYSERIQRQ